MQGRRFAVAGLVLALLTALRVAATWTVFSQTYDEPVHLHAGLERLATNHYDVDPEHPPLARVLFALDAWASDVPDSQLLLRVDHYRRDLAGMRAGNLPFLLLGLAVVYFWTRRLFGPAEAVISVALFGSLPPVLAHAGLATTDMAGTATTAAALYALWLWCESPSRTRAGVLGLAIGAGLLAKFSFILFFGVGAIVFLLACRPRRLRQLGLSAVIAAALVWAGYGFRFGTMRAAYPSHSVHFQAARYAEAPGYSWVRADHIERYRRFADDTKNKTGLAGIDFVDWAKASGFPSPLAGRSGTDTMAKAPPVPSPSRRDRLIEPVRRAQHWVANHVPIPAPLFFIGIERVSLHSDTGHPSFILGQRGRDGWWYFFPVLLFFKTPLPFLVLTIAGVVLLCRRHSALIVAPLFMILLLLPSRINLGIRHVLPVYPLLTLFAAFATTWLWRGGPGRRALVVALLLWFFVPVAIDHPDYLPWFNEAAGKHPERIAVDSNLDWGQDLLRLKETVRRGGYARIHLSYFGSADPNLHGIPAVPLSLDNRCVEGWVAVSETNRAMFHESFAWLDAHKPIERAGRTIPIYAIKRCP